MKIPVILIPGKRAPSTVVIARNVVPTVNTSSKNANLVHRPGADQMLIYLIPRYQFSDGGAIVTFVRSGMRLRVDHKFSHVDRRLCPDAGENLNYSIVVVGMALSFRRRGRNKGCHIQPLGVQSPR